jgi:(1->4)-alpha-D-glucan 1-alpha-D-glucosylmutase
VAYPPAQLDRLSETDRHSRDFTFNSLTHALREIIACFPVYRTYVDETGVTERDRDVIGTAVACAKRRNPATDTSIFNFVREVLLLHSPNDAGAEAREARRAFVMKFQQCTSPVMAKGMEDTAFYIYNRLVSLNEVGGTPERFGSSLGAFHEYNQERLRHWPHTLLATATHDTKRGEDVRARINVLSEIPEEWRAALRSWSKRNKKKKPMVDGQPVPARNEEYLFYQTLLGAWPLTPMNAHEQAVFTRRIQEYMRKATKEAKVNTSWINPNQAYDEALWDFVRAVLGDALFFEDFRELSEKITQCGMYNSLAQTLLKLTAPCVPDTYQGAELWDFALVDPDNRRPVDYDHRRRLLHSLQERLHEGEHALLALARELLTSRIDGRIKLYVTHQALMCRRAHPRLFRAGDYAPLNTSDPKD